MQKRSGTRSGSHTGGESDSARDLGRGNRLALDRSGLVTQLGYALLELVVARAELGQALGGHVGAGFAATDGPQYTFDLLAAPLLFGSERARRPSCQDRRAR
jgi:hypothetical protein